MTEAGASNSTKPIRIANGILALPAAVSLGVGIVHGLQRGQDFQWSGSHLLLQRIDPFQQFLRGDPEHLILASQNPNYLHELYVLLLPLGMLPFEKARAIFLVVNILLSIACVLLLSRIYTLDRSHTLFLGITLAMSTPFRITLANGQHALLEMLFLALLLTTIASKGLWFGLSYFKYSFTPVFFLYFVFQSRWRLLLWSLLAPLLGVLVFWLFLHGNLLRLAIEPLLAGRPGGRGVNFGAGDLASILFTAVPALGDVRAQQIGFAVGIAGSTIIAWIVAQRRLTDAAAFAALVPASLFLLVHLTYDYVLLLVPLAATLALSSQNTPRRLLSLGSIALLWFVTPNIFKISTRIPELPIQLLVCALLILLIVCHLPSNPAALQGAAHE